MSNLPKVLALLLVATVAMVFAQSQPGYSVLAYDQEDANLHRTPYAGNGYGFGVRFTPATSGARYAEIKEVDVRLCPPPMDYPYTEQIFIYGVKNNGQPDFSNVLGQTAEFNVIPGYWWHYEPLVSPIWVARNQQVFAVAYAMSGYQYLYQFFDDHKDAAARTQWAFNKNNSTAHRLTPQENTYGDIMIHLVINKHDFGVASITRPTGLSFVPVVHLRNLTGFAEDCDVNYWVTKGGVIQGAVQTKTWHAPADGNIHAFSFDQITLDPRTTYRLHCQTMYAHDMTPSNDKAVISYRTPRSAVPVPGPETMTR